MAKNDYRATDKNGGKCNLYQAGNRPSRKQTAMDCGEYAALLPTRPPADMVPWLKTHGYLHIDVAIFKASGKTVLVRCADCGAEWDAEKIPGSECGYHGMPGNFGFLAPDGIMQISSGKTVKCPFCGRQLTARHVSEWPRSGVLTDHIWPMTIGRVGDRLTLTGWCVEFGVTKQGEHSIDVWPYEGYVVERRKIIRLAAYTKCMTTLKLGREWKQRKKYSDVWGRADLIYPFDKNILEGTTAENSKLDRYLRCKPKEPYPVSYLRLWLKHPNAENLLMQGAGKILAEMIEKDAGSHCGYYSNSSAAAAVYCKGINWKDPRPAQMLGLNKNEFRWCREQKWSLDDLSRYKFIRDKGEALCMPEDIRLLRMAEEWQLCKLAEAGQPVMRCLRYLDRQKSRAQDDKNRTLTVSTLRDTWSMAIQCGADLNNPGVRFPKDLLREHDRYNRELTAIWEKEQVEKRAAEIAARADAFAQRATILEALAWEHDGIVIRPPRDEAELAQEGKKLNHCVASYAASIAKGKTDILLIRRVEAPDKPWYTLEFREEDFSAVQNRGKNNCARTSEVEAFEAAWLSWLQSNRPVIERKLYGREDKPVRKGSAA